jgi:pyruvate carboxylase
MLSLENNSDLVPHLDARSDADAVNHTTVTFDLPGQAHNIGVAHSIRESYLPAAQRLDQGGVASVDAFTASVSAFLGTPSDTTITTDRYYASRDQPRGGSE